jgi:hypothetical protein
LFFSYVVFLGDAAIISPLSQSVFYNSNHNTNTNIVDFSPSSSFQSTNSDIQIKNAKGGLNLAITFKNNGTIPYRNIEIAIKSTNGILFTPRTKDYTIPLLKPNGGSEYTLQNQLFGISLNPIKPLHITILLNNSADGQVIGQIYGFLIGPYIKIIESFFNEENSFQGYNLYSPEYGKNVYLMNNAGEIMYEWKTGNIQGMGTYLLDNGNIIRSDISKINPIFPSGGVTGHVGIYDPKGYKVWDFSYSNEEYCLHHDIEPLPNGNILMIAWEYLSNQEAIELGRNPDTLNNRLLTDYLIEVKPLDGNPHYEIVWEWHVLDHLIQDYDGNKPNYGDVSDHPKRINFNYGKKSGDFTHINSIDYNKEYDQILLSVREFGEIWVIDHSTTTSEAANQTGGTYGNGGDLLYRWGNPAAYDAGTEDDQQLFGTHDASWITNDCPGGGNMLVFNNNNPPIDETNPNLRFSSVVEILPPINATGAYYKIGATFGPRKPTWIYYDRENPHDFYSFHLSSAQRLPNGNTLVCEGNKGKFMEITHEKEIVWQYTNPFGTPNHVFKLRRYSPDDLGIQNLLD